MIKEEEEQARKTRTTHLFVKVVVKY